MKVQSIELKYFKKFKEINLDFTDKQTGLAQNVVLLIGKNGAGKTTILQAIAAMLGEATGRLKNFADLEWPGFNFELLSSGWHRLDPEVNLKIQFSVPEIQATQEFYRQLPPTETPLVPPGDQHLVTLKWCGERVQAANSAAELFQFRGRQYAKPRVRAEGFSVFERVGTIFWYTEQRTSTSLTSEDPNTDLQITDDNLRDKLSKWRQFHLEVERGGRIQSLRPGQKDLYAEIERAYQKIFPGRSFEGVVLRENVDAVLKEPWFYLYDKQNLYEISEMSGGERAIFPIVFDFANWNIHHSIILIDEIELHLHPPLQQALLRALPKLGQNNQFIITTHSDYVAQFMPESHIIRLEM